MTIRSLTVTLGLVMSALLGCANAAAQSPGERLRITATNPVEVRVGAFQSATPAGVTISIEDQPRLFALERIRQVEASSGRKPSIVAGVLGAVLGAGIGGVIGCAANRDSYGVFCGGQSDTKVVVGAVIGGLVGGGAGLLLFQTERWQPVDLERFRSVNRR